MNPKIQTVAVEDISTALLVLEQSWKLPDGSEVADKNSFNDYRRQLSKGYFYRLVWPTYATRADIEEWVIQADYIITLHKAGLVQQLGKQIPKI